MYYNPFYVQFFSLYRNEGNVTKHRLISIRSTKVCKHCQRYPQKIIEHETLQFSGHFPPNCQSNYIPYNLKLLIAMILFGPTAQSEASINSQVCSTVAQLILFNVKKTPFCNQKQSRHSLDREPPLPIFIGLNIHSQARSKKND